MPRLLSARAPLPIVLLALLGAAACSDSTGDGAGSKSDGGTAPHTGDGCPKGTPMFAFGDNGLTVKNAAGGYSVRLTDASASPPMKYENDWSVRFEDDAKKPLDSAQIAWICTFMPLHGHGTNPPLGDDGVKKLSDGDYQLHRLNFFMEGGWETQIWVDPEGKSGDTYDPSKADPKDPCRAPSAAPPDIVFHVCVPKE